MKRGVFETLRRGLDNTFVNWPLIAIRVVEGIVFILLAIVVGVAVLVPILVSIGIEFAEISSPEDIQGAALSLLGKWTLLLWIAAAVVGLLFVLAILHSFVEAGCARVYVDGEIAAGPAESGARSRFRAFAMDRWASGGWQGWWTVFWIYNLAWGAASVILLLPLLPTIVLMLVFREEPAIAAGTGCLGLLLTLMLAIAVAVVTGMWSNRAIAEWAAHRTGAAASLKVAWAALRADLGRHLLIAAAILIVALAGSSVFASFSFLAAFGQTMNDAAIFSLFALPLRMAGSILNMIFSSIVACWALASYSALAVERRVLNEE